MCFDVCSLFVLQRTSLLWVAQLGSFRSATLRRRMTGKGIHATVIH